MTTSNGVRSSVLVASLYHCPDRNQLPLKCQSGGQWLANRRGQPDRTCKNARQTALVRAQNMRTLTHASDSNLRRMDARTSSDGLWSTKLDRTVAGTTSCRYIASSREGPLSDGSMLSAATKMGRQPLTGSRSLQERRLVSYSEPLAQSKLSLCRIDQKRDWRTFR